MYRRYFKRAIDFLLSLTAIIILSPVLLVLAATIRVKLGTPVIFSQKRPGLNEKIFTMYKFRTMTDARDEKVQLLPDEMRLTKFGKMLRASSLDELPELSNIIRGDMSVIGPRPLLVQYLPLYSDEQRQRHSVRPGLTGFAQVNGMTTSSETIDFALNLSKELGKKPVLVEEAPGFIVNRMLIPMINEAVSIYSEGVATIEDIDTAMRSGANHPIGPLALADLIGLDVCLNIMDILHTEFGLDKYTAHPLLRKMVRANKLGRKTREGFYKY